MPGVPIRPIADVDRRWLSRFVIDRWGAASVVGHGVVSYPAALPRFVAAADEAVVGLITDRMVASACEAVTLDCRWPGTGIGSALLTAVEAVAASVRCGRIWLLMTNDNLTALRFYQKRGYRLVGLDPGAVERARRLKPEIPRVGDHDPPIRDELERERRLAAESM